MESFKILLRFSLEKRIFNKTFIIVNALIALLLGLLFFVDTYIRDVLPNLFEKPVVYTNDVMLYDFLETYMEESFNIKTYEHDVFPITKDSEYLLENNEVFDITIYKEKNDLELALLQNALLQFQQTINYSILFDQHQLLDKEIVLHRIENEEESEGEKWGFIVVTGIYFFAMSFASIVANDVVYEKATRMMEIILTNTSATVHLFAKLSAGWLVLLIQFGLLVGEALILCIIRFAYDKFEGLFNLLEELGYINGEYHFSLKFIWELLKDNYKMIGLIILALIIMFLGILLIQAILVILSSFISNIEEAGNVQSPFYLLFLMVYYLTLFLDNAASMNNGIGRTLSMVPFFSMLFMPCRIFCYKVSVGEIIVSLSSSFGALSIILFVGSGLYKRGVLDYSSNSLFKKIR